MKRKLKALPNAQQHYTADAHKLLKTLSRDKDIKAVIVVAYKKDGSAGINRSLSNYNELCFMKCCLDAWLYKKWEEDN